MTAPELGEEDYLREIECLAHRVSVEASRDGWVCLSDDPEDATPLQASVNILARTLRSYHFPGDGCTEEDRPMTRPVGAAVLRPQVMPAGVEESYEEACARLGVASRPEGRALWNTWGEGDLEVTLVASAIETTEGLLENWSRGRSVDPVSALPSRIAVVRRGWIGPMTLAPRAARRPAAVLGVLASDARHRRPGRAKAPDARRPVSDTSGPVPGPCRQHPPAATRPAYRQHGTQYPWPGGRGGGDGGD